MVSSEYTTPLGLLGEFTITALVAGVILLSKSAISIWKVLSSGLLITIFPPAFSMNTLYSVKKGAKTIHSSPIPSSITVFKQMERDAAAPQVI